MLFYTRKLLATTTGVPRPLAIRSDSLLVQCLIAAGIWFVPQDAAAVTLGLLYGRSNSRNINAPANVSDPDKAVSKYLASRGISADNVDISQGSRTWEVKMKTVYQ